ncbi:MAG TPA: hypothetical protein VNE59_11305 [Burkholderiales bacterium]|nr:hypothetical protein [Burkholderiales bacterium]
MLGRMMGHLMAQVAGKGGASTPPEFALYVPAEVLERLDESTRETVQRALLAHNLGRFRESASLLRSTLKRSQSNSDLLALLGMSELEAGHEQEARRSLQHASRLEPKISYRYHEAGGDLFQRGHREQAQSCFLIASQLNPAEAAHFITLGDVLMSIGRDAEARAWYEQGVKVEARPGYVMKSIIAGLQAVYDSADQMVEARKRYERELVQLEQLAVRLDHPHIEVSYLPFYLAFIGMNDRELHQRLARIYLKACPALAYVAPHCRPGHTRKPGPLRVGFASAFFRSHSVGHCYNNLIHRLLLRQDLDVHVITLGDELDPHLLQLAGPRSRHIPISRTDLDECRNSVAGLELDALLYGDIGMQPTAYFLAFARLAPMQMCMAGHPVTTGVPNVDSYLSSELIERPDADAHYSERLIRLRSLPVVFPRPAAPERLLDKASLGVSEDRHLYVCPMKLQKVHPDFDRAIAEILRRDPDAEVVMFQDHNSPAWDLQVKKRFAKSFADVFDRVNFLPWANAQEFFSILTHADAALDTFHFGAGTTALWVLAAGCPFVTLPGRMMASRGLLACYRKMGVMDCVASDFDDYVAKVLRLGRDRSLRDSVSARILEHNAAIYMNYEVADELAELLPRLASERAAAPGMAEAVR